MEAQADGAITCPFCGDNVPLLVPVEAGMRLRLQGLQQNTQLGPVPDRVCEGCMRQLAKAVSKGAILRSEQQQKEQNRLMLWRNRVQLVKQAKTLLSQKNFSAAAVSYEKYLRVLEIVYESKPGGLSPDLFKAQARAQEMTVIASVYWDLMRIYDTSASFKERQMRAAEKLAEFARFTPIFGHIARKAEIQQAIAKNPEAFKKFRKLSNASRPRCFIATAAFDHREDPVVRELCRFREEFLRESRAGRRFILFYYQHSPRLARALDRHPALKPAVRKALTWMASASAWGRSSKKGLSR